MASTTIINFPDGRKEPIKVLTSFEKNGTNVIVFDTNKVDNGLTVTGVSYLADGMYQNIIDEDKWKEVRGYLVDILHDNISNEEYRLVSEEILATADPYHPLSLREANLDKLVSSYENFKNTTMQNNAITEVQNVDISAVNEQPVVGEIPSIQPEIPMEVPTIMDTPDATNMDILTVNEQPVVGETPNIQPEIPMEAPTIMDTPDATNMDILTVNEQPVVGEIPNIQPEVAVVNSMPDSSQETSEIVADIPILDAVSNSLESDSANMTSGEGIVDHSMNSFVEPMEDLTVQPQPVLSPEIPVSEEIPNNKVDTNPVIDIKTQEDSQIEEESAVANNYLSNIISMEDKVRQMTNDYVSKVQTLSEEYIKEVGEIRTEIKGYFKEAKEINQLSKDTFDKAQAMTQNANVVQMPSVNEGPTLTREVA